VILGIPVAMILLSSANEEDREAECNYENYQLEAVREVLLLRLPWLPAI
jgi:hypothetical protein